MSDFARILSERVDERAEQEYVHQLGIGRGKWAEETTDCEGHETGRM